jgi:hypothetical protein
MYATSRAKPGVKPEDAATKADLAAAMLRWKPANPLSSVLSQISIYNRAWPLYTEACSGRRPRWP